MGYKIMKGERFPSALTLNNIMESATSDGAPVHEHPTAKFLDEIGLLRFEQAIMNKPDWRRKIMDKGIVAKWKVEALQYEIRAEVFDYALQELKWLAEAGNPENGIEPSGVDLVWRSDKLIAPDLRNRFVEAVEQFAASKVEKDYHPGSNEQVINLVHPSLFCLVYGKSKDMDDEIIEFTEKVPNASSQGWGNPIVHVSQLWSHSYLPAEEDPIVHVSQLWSHNYQWLPAEFLVDNEGKVKIGSYINSLPLNSGLYPPIAEIFERVVPLFNRVLTDLRANRLRVRFPKRGDYYWWDEVYPPDELDELDIEAWESSRTLIPVPIPAFDPAKLDVCSKDMVDLKGNRLQVIVKIGSIELSPEKPDFPGGNWHVEGMANEKIVSTAIYYYDSENIESDWPKFRQAVEMSNMYVAQYDDSGADRMFGIGRGRPMVQAAGLVKTPSGRVLVFPNIYQHSIEAFSLQDKTKKGHRKILVFFLVDPTQRIISTERVPPQDLSWEDNGVKFKLGNELPVEVAEIVRGQLGYEMTLDEVKVHRLKLMEERSVAKDAVTQAIFKRPFDLCEH